MNPGYFNFYLETSRKIVVLDLYGGFLFDYA